MSKIIKILFIPCVLFLIVCFNFINVYAFESNECSIIFDGCDNYSDFRNKLNGSTNVYILVKIKDSEYENVKNEFQYYEIYSADFYISNYIPYISIIYDSDTEFISGYYEIEELAKFDYFEYIFISLELKSSKDDTLNTLINETTYSWKKVIEDIGLNSNNEYINGNIKIGMLENSVVEFDKISYNNTFGNTLNVTVYDDESDESSDGLNHATIVCSIIAEITKNIHSVSIHSGTIDNFLENLDLFCEENIKIVNISWGGYDSDTENLYTKLDAIFDAYSKEKNIVFIKSSGNENEGVTSPGKGGNVISVGACDSSYNIYEGSGYSIIDRKPTLIAPGVNLDLEFINDDNNNNNCNYYNGTSYSCAIVAGVVSLLYAQYSDNLNNVEIINSILIAGAKKLNKSDDSYNVKSGFGLINYQSSKNIIIGNKYNYYENVDTYYSITNTMPSYSSLEFILFTFSQYDIPEENNTDSLDVHNTVHFSSAGISYN